MQALLIAAWVGISGGTGFLAATASPIVIEQFSSPPPQVLTDETALPGRRPYNASALRTGWQYTYLEPKARVEPGKQVPMRTRIHLWFGDDGVYQLFYSARWSSSGAANPIGARDMDGVDVNESGKFSLSDDILLLEPTRTDFTQRAKGAVVRQEIAENQRRVYLVHAEPTTLHIAGRCASYQVEPICREGSNIWYQLSATRVEPVPRRDTASKQKPPPKRD